VATLGLALAGPATASAAIEIRTSDTGALLSSVDKLKCKTDKRARYPFEASGFAADRTYAIGVGIRRDAWQGPGSAHAAYYGDDGAYISVQAATVQYSSTYAIPGTPPGVVTAGSIKPSKNGKRVAVGAFGLPDPTFATGVSLTGAAKCKRPRR
jgi:hypothetical protein